MEVYMNLDIEKIKKIMSINIEQLTKDDLKTYIRELAQYIAYIKGIKINISFTEIEDTEIAKCYTSKQLSNNQITTYYNINFCLKNFNKPGAFDNESIKQIPMYVRLIRVISHEIEHAVQKEDIIKNSWLPNANSISIAKESLCGFQNYYWDKLKGEFNAEIEGWKMTLDILQQLELENDYSDIINKCITSLIEQEQTAQIEAIVNEEKTILPAQQMVTLFASEYIKRNPELLKYNPCLRFVYNSNGIKKNFDELMSDKIALLEKTKNMN